MAVASGADHADVLIVGAGASGSVVARRLAIADFSVVCLEQGPWVNASEYAGGALEREVMQEGTWHYNPNHRGRPEDYPCEVSDSEIHPLMFNAVGGSTVHYAAEWTRLLPSDFRVRTLDGIADDWPLDYFELAPFYERVERWMSVSGRVGDPAYPPGFVPPLPPHPIGLMGRRAAEGFNRLGWHWWNGYNAIASRPDGRLNACVRRATCMQGCPEGAKASVDVTVWPDAIAAGARLITGARVRRITTDSSGLATGAEWIDRDGAEHRQSADLVVLAANGVGTARLLLLSGSPSHPEGLANSSGLVGKRLQMHPLATAQGVYEDELETWMGPYGEGVTSSQFAETDLDRGFPRGARLTVMPIPGPIELLWGNADRPLAERSGAALHRLMRFGLGHAFELAASLDDLPDERNSVTLDPELTDGDGIPAPKITWRRQPHHDGALRWFAERMVEVHEAAGASETRPSVEPGEDIGWHLLGTARMGNDSQHSVVDPFCRAHDVENLFVVDGSVFVTSGSTNPTGTIMALALRAADHIVDNASGQRTPVR